MPLLESSYGNIPCCSWPNHSSDVVKWSSRGSTVHTDTGRTEPCPNSGGWHVRYRGLSRIGSKGSTVDEVDQSQLVGRQFQAQVRPWLTTEADTQASLHKSSVTPVVSTDYMGRQDLSLTGGWLAKSSFYNRWVPYYVVDSSQSAQSSSAA